MYYLQRIIMLLHIEPEYVNKTDLLEINPENTSKFLNIENIYLGVKILQVLNSDQLKTVMPKKFMLLK